MKRNQCQNPQTTDAKNDNKKESESMTEHVFFGSEKT
jgi:hypothetical protein